MGLREQAALDAQAILEDKTSGFAWSFTLTSPQGVAAKLKGFTTDIGQTIDPDTGHAVAGRRASVALPLLSLPELPVLSADESRKPWLVRFFDAKGVAACWKAIEIIPDRAAGIVVLLLEAYHLAPDVVLEEAAGLPSLRQQAIQDSQAILEDTFGFGTPITLTSPAGVMTALTGFATDIGVTIDPETGQSVSGRRASVAVPLLALPEIPVVSAGSSKKPWLVRFFDLKGVAAAWKAIEVLPDRALGVVVLLLEAYQQTIVTLASSVLVFPSLLLSGSFLPVVALSGALALPLPLLAGPFEPQVGVLSGALALPAPQLAGDFSPVVGLTSAGLVLPELQLAGDLTPAVAPIAAALMLPGLQLAGAFSPEVGLSSAAWVLPGLQLAGAPVPVAAVGAAAFVLPSLLLAGSVAPQVALAGALVLPQMQLAGSVAPTVGTLSGALALPQMQLAGTFTVDASKVSAILVVANGTITGAGYSSIPDAFTNNPAVQSVDARRPAAATSELGLPILSFNGANVLSWPLAANNGQLTAPSAPGSVVGWCGWVKFASVAAATAYLYCARNGVGGLLNRRLAFGALTNTLTNLVHTVDGGGNMQGVTPAPTIAAGAWLWLRYMWIASGAADANRILIYVNGALQSLNWVGTGTIPSLPATTGNILLGAFNNDTTLTLSFTGFMGPRLYNLIAEPTAAQELAMLSLDRPAPAYDPQIVGVTAQTFNTTHTAFSVTLPARVVGDRLVMCITRRLASSDVPSSPFPGWLPIDTSGATGTASSYSKAYYQDVTAGNVGLATADFVGGSAGCSASLIWRLSGCDPGVSPVANGIAQQTNGIATINPAALTAGAAGRNLWLVYLGTTGQDNAFGTTPAVVAGGWPAGYGNTGTNSTTLAGASNGVSQGWASKVAVSASDDPGAWTYLPTPPGGRAFAMTICVRGVQF